MRRSIDELTGELESLPLCLPHPLLSLATIHMTPVDVANATGTAETALTRRTENRDEQKLMIEKMVDIELEEP